MADTQFPPLKREPLLEEELPAANPTVRLIKDGQTVARATTDNYGDFKFDRLDENSGRYTIEVMGLGRTKMLDASLGASVFLGEIRL